MLAHHLINRLTVIVGYCDLLVQEAPEDSERMKRLLQMREIATSAAAELGQHECELETIMAPVPARPVPPVPSVRRTG